MLLILRAMTYRNSIPEDDRKSIYDTLIKMYTQSVLGQKAQQVVDVLLDSWIGSSVPSSIPLTNEVFAILRHWAGQFQSSSAVTLLRRCLPAGHINDGMLKNVFSILLK